MGGLFGYVVGEWLCRFMMFVGVFVLLFVEVGGWIDVGFD